MAPAHTALGAVTGLDTKSPDGHATVTVHEDANDNARAALVVGRHIYRLSQIDKLKTSASLVDVKWSPDSQVVSLNVSDGGAVGDFHAMIYRLHGKDAPAFVDIEPLLAPYLRHFSHCDGGPEINYVAAAWPAGGRQAAILASVPGHSLCRNMGDYKAFILDTRTWRIVKIIPQRQIPKTWTPARYNITIPGLTLPVVLASQP